MDPISRTKIFGIVLQILALSPLIMVPRIVMEYCGGGSVSDICQIIESGINEDQIALVCREALKVSG